MKNKVYVFIDKPLLMQLLLIAVYVKSVRYAMLMYIVILTDMAQCNITMLFILLKYFVFHFILLIEILEKNNLTSI